MHCRFVVRTQYFRTSLPARSRGSYPPVIVTYIPCLLCIVTCFPDNLWLFLDVPTLCPNTTCSHATPVTIGEWTHLVVFHPFFEGRQFLWLLFCFPNSDLFMARTRILVRRWLLISRGNKNSLFRSQHIFLIRDTNLWILLPPSPLHPLNLSYRVQELWSGQEF